MSLLIFLLLFVALCGWLDHWATRTPDSGSKEGH